MGDPKSLSIVFASSGGSGVMTAGVIFLRAAAGYYGRMTQLLRLGSWQRVRVIGVYSVDPVGCQPDRYAVLIVLDG
jgi:hypothetical protein